MICELDITDVYFRACNKKEKQQKQIGSNEIKTGILDVK